MLENLQTVPFERRGRQEELEVERQACFLDLQISCACASCKGLWAFKRGVYSLGVCCEIPRPTTKSRMQPRWAASVRVVVALHCTQQSGTGLVLDVTPTLCYTAPFDSQALVRNAMVHIDPRSSSLEVRPAP